MDEWRIKVEREIATMKQELTLMGEVRADLKALQRMMAGWAGAITLAAVIVGPIVASLIRHAFP